MKLVYPACFYKEVDGGYSVDIPDLLGCCTQGDSLEEAISQAEDAALRVVINRGRRGKGFT